MGQLTYTTAQVQAILDAVDDKQDGITVSGIVKGDGAGNLTAQTVDDTVTEDSANLITSGAVYAVCGDVESVLEGLL
jgi:hypothetical protein